MTPSVRDANGMPVASVAGSASRPGPAAAQLRGNRGELAAQGDLQGEAVEGGEYLLLGPGQVIADLGLLVNGMTQLGDIPGNRGCFRAQCHGNP